MKQPIEALLRPRSIAILEVLKDVVFRAAPVTPAEAGRMLEES
jgi:hypothetical protein